MKNLIIDRVAIWQSKNGDELTIKKSPPGRVYFENNISRVADKPMYRYAKNYKVGRGKTAISFCLFLVSFSDSKNLVENFLDKTAKKVDKSIAQKAILNSSFSNFDYLDEYYNGGK